MIPELYPKIYLYRRIVQAKLFMDKFYFNHIYLDNIADEAYFSKFHFIRLFKKIYNKTPHQYLMYVRIEKARQLLQSNTTVSEVCFSIGFNSISSFTGLFKKTVSLTHSAYQNIQHQLKLDIAISPLILHSKFFCSKKRVYIK